MHQKQGKLYQRRLENYHSLSAAKAYVSFHEFIGTYPPSGATIRFLYKQAERSNTGMTEGLVDCLTLRGAAEHNVEMRHSLALSTNDANRTLFHKTPITPEYIREYLLHPSHTICFSACAQQ
jgi:hypothetical protein